DKDGSFRFVNLRPGKYQVRCQSALGQVYYGSGRDQTSSPASIDVETRRTHPGVDFRIPETKKGIWRTYAVAKGLVQQRAATVWRHPDGILWIGTLSAGVYQFDGVEFEALSESEGLSGSRVFAIRRAADGSLWIGTNNGINRHDGKRLQEVPFKDLDGRNVF